MLSFRTSITILDGNGSRSLRFGGDDNVKDPGNNTQSC
jgi:hypothetical protein